MVCRGSLSPFPGLTFLQNAFQSLDWNVGLRHPNGQVMTTAIEKEDMIGDAIVSNAEAKKIKNEDHVEAAHGMSSLDSNSVSDGDEDSASEDANVPIVHCHMIQAPPSDDVDMNESGVVALSARPTWEVGPPQNLDDLDEKIRALIAYSQGAVSGAAAYQQVTVDHIQKIYDDLGRIIAQMGMMFHHEKYLSDVMHKLGPFTFGIRLDLERLNLAVRVAHDQQSQRIVDRFQEWELRLDEKFKCIAKFMTETTREMEAHRQSVSSLRGQVETCIKGLNDLAALRIPEWHQACQHAMAWQNEFRAVVPDLEEAVMKMNGLEPKIEEVRDQNLQAYSDAMVEVKKHENQLDFLYAQNLELGERVDTGLQAMAEGIENVNKRLENIPIAREPPAPGGGCDFCPFQHA